MNKTMTKHYKVEKTLFNVFLPSWNEFVKTFVKSVKKVTGNKPMLSTTGGTSDARFIKKISPCLEFGLVNKTMHKVDECVSISDLKKLTNIYKDILTEYFKWNYIK